MKKGIHTGISRRSILRIGTGATLLAAMPYVSRAQAAATVEEAVEWARKTLPNSTPDIVNAAAKEGKLVLTMLNLGGNDDALRGMIQGFNQRYPFVAVEFTQQSTVQLLNKFNSELAAKKGISDYLNLPSNLKTTAGLEKQGALLPFVTSQDEAFPKAAKRSGQWYTWRIDQSVTAYRSGTLTDEEKKLIGSFTGLADPRFKDRLGIGSVNNSIPVAAAYVLMYHADPKAWQGLAANQPKVKASASAVLDGVLAGEFDIAPFGAASTCTTAAQQGAPIEFVVTGPSPNLYTPAGISALAPNPNAAKLWQDWVMSAEGQDTWVRLSGSMAVRTDGTEKSWAEKQPWFFDDRSTHHDIDWDDFTEKQPSVIERFKKDLQAG